MLSTWLIGGLILYFAILLGLSLYKRKTSNPEEYFLAGRTTPSWMLGLAFVATWYGGNSALISVDEAYETGMRSWWVLGGPTIIAVVALIWLGPMIRRIGTLSQNGIMLKRYNAASANLLSVVLSIYLIVWGASQMVALGNFFVSFFGIPYVVAVLVGLSVALIYSTLGGFRAVVLTEAFQFFLLTAGLIVTMVVAISLSGGWDEINQAVQNTREPGYFNLFGGFTENLTYIISFGLAFTIDGAAWQRIQASSSPRGARRVSITALAGFVPLYFLVVIAGIASVAIFSEVPEGGIISTLAAEYMPPWLATGVFIGIAAAIMSTIVTTLNVSSLYMTELFVKYRRPQATHQRRVLYGMVATVFAATIGFLIAVQLPEALGLLALASEIIAAGLFIPMIAGFFWRRGTSSGAIASIIAGGGFILYGFVIELGLPLPHFWEGGATRILIGIVLSFVAYVSVSLATKPEFAKADAFKILARNTNKQTEEQATNVTD